MIGMKSHDSESESRPKGAYEDLFNQMLPQTNETIKVELPRGLRFALGKQLAGLSSTRMVDQLPIKGYSITVEPHGSGGVAAGRLPPSREGTAGSSSRDRLPSPRNRAPSEPEGEPHMLDSGDKAYDAIIEERHGRTMFRKERMTLFESHRHVPCLVCPRLVPSWRGEKDSGDVMSPAQEANKKIQEAFQLMNRKVKSGKHTGKKMGNMGTNFVVPTVSVAQKRTPKHIRREEYWAPSSSSEARRNLFGLHEHVPAEFEGFTASEAMRLRESIDLEDSKARRIHEHDIVSGSASTCPPFDKEKLKRQVEVKQARKKGKYNQEELRDDYVDAREHFKTKQKERGAKSSFDRYWRDHRIKAVQDQQIQLAEAKLEEEKKNLIVRSSLANIMSLGLSRIKKDTTQDSAPAPMPPPPDASITAAAASATAAAPASTVISA